MRRSAIVAVLLLPFLLDVGQATALKSESVHASVRLDWNDCIDAVRDAGATLSEATAACTAAWGNSDAAVAAYQAAAAVIDAVEDLGSYPDVEETPTGGDPDSPGGSVPIPYPKVEDAFLMESMLAYMSLMADAFQDDKLTRAVRAVVEDARVRAPEVLEEIRGRNPDLMARVDTLLENPLSNRDPLVTSPQFRPTATSTPLPMLPVVGERQLTAPASGGATATPTSTPTSAPGRGTPTSGR